MNEKLQKELITMADLDQKVRRELVRRGVLFDGYHSEMEQIHNINADRLAEIIDEYGWPSQRAVGKEASEAAWLIVQHAISKPDFQRKCLKILKAEVEKGSVDPKHAAYLEDRIHVFEGKPQIYGTNFNWDADGFLSPTPIQDISQVDELRKSVGLASLKETIERHRFHAIQAGEQPPKEPEKKQEMFIQWAKKVGWRR